MHELTQAESTSWWHVPMIVHVSILEFRKKIKISEATEKFETNKRK